MKTKQTKTTKAANEASKAWARALIIQARELSRLKLEFNEGPGDLSVKQLQTLESEVGDMSRDVLTLLCGIEVELGYRLGEEAAAKASSTRNKEPKRNRVGKQG
jgi:hypothetical protein